MPQAFGGSTITDANQIANGIITNAHVNAAAAIAGSKLALTLSKMCKVGNTGNQSINNNSETALTFNIEEFDTDTMHESVTNPTRITIKTAGKYLFLVNMTWQNNATGQRKITLYRNGAEVLAKDIKYTVSASAEFQRVATIQDCALNDYIEAKVYQDSGGALNAFWSGVYTVDFFAAFLIPA